MNYSQIGSDVKKLYNAEYAKAYRLSDAEAVTTENFAHYQKILQRITSNPLHPVKVLDLGCGTGRFFHCCQNTSFLLGIDISPDILEQAKAPIYEEAITAKQRELRCGNIFHMHFPSHSFDVIYSIGVLGEHSPLDLPLALKFFDMLGPNGQIFLTVVDKDSKQNPSLQRRIAEQLYPWMPPMLQKRLNVLWQNYYMTKQEIENLFTQTSFRELSIEHHVSTSSQWRGAHFEIFARK